MTKRMIIMLAIVGVLFGGLFGFKAFLGGVIRKSIAAQGIPPQTVSTAKAQFTEWQGEFQAVGTLRAKPSNRSNILSRQAHSGSSGPSTSCGLMMRAHWNTENRM